MTRRHSLPPTLLHSEGLSSPHYTSTCQLFSEGNSDQLVHGLLYCTVLVF
jgi:hypothetical protein